MIKVGFPAFENSEYLYFDLKKKSENSCLKNQKVVLYAYLSRWVPYLNCEVEV